MCNCKQCMMKQQQQPKWGEPIFKPEQPKWEEPQWKPAPQKWEPESCWKPEPTKYEPCFKPEPSRRPEPCDVIVIHEEPVYCCEEEYRYHIVKHIVPVIVKKDIVDVYKHEYVIEKEEKVDHRREDVGIRHENWCDVVGCDGKDGHKKPWC